MAIPEINIKATGMDHSDQHREIIEERIHQVDRLVEDGQDITCDVEVERTSNAEAGKQYRGEANLSINGTLHRAEAYADSIESAFDEVRNQLKKELRRTKDKQGSLLRRGGRKLKEWMRFGQE